jgi:hypothetical protein
LGVAALVGGVLVWTPFRAAAITQINESFAYSTTDTPLTSASQGTGASGQPLPCLTAAIIDQSSPTAISISTSDANGFTDQNSTVGNNGSVTFVTTASTSSDVSVDSTGDVSTSGDPGAGPYTVSGTDSDGSDDTGIWSYTLNVDSSTPPINQSAPTAGTATTTTVVAAMGFTDQLATTDSGTVTFTTTTSSPYISVDTTGAVSNSEALDVGSYTVSGTDTDTSANNGTWSYTLHVTSSSSTIENCDAVSPDSDGSGSLMLTDAGFGEASSVIYSSDFPTNEGLDLTFDTHMFGGSPLASDGGSYYADGISFDLALPNPGAVGQSGGALGYSTDQTVPGMPDGYLGVGLDEFGNFSTSGYEGTDCAGSDPSWVGYAPNEVTVRGPGDGTTGYCPLSSSIVDAPDAMGPSGAIQLHGSEITVHVVIDTTTDPSSPTYLVSLQPVGAAAPTTVASGPLPPLYYDSEGNPVSSIPPELTFAIAGSTGSGSDFHEINNLSVNSANLTSITVTPSATSISAGGTQQYTATGTYSDGSTEDISSEVNWGSGTTSVATISTGGLATGVADGTSTITASDGSVLGTASLTVGPTLSTVLSQPGPVAVGASVSDTATIGGATADAGGNISYGVYSDSDCTQLIQDLTPRPSTVTDGAVPPSDSYTFGATGTFYFQATYSGDANNTGPVSSACTSETIAVNQAAPTLTTALSETSPVTVGATVYDTATLVGASADAGGNISYGLYSDSDCTQLIQDLTPRPSTVTDGAVPPSDSYTFDATGTFYFQATYSGDANNTGPVSSPVRVGEAGGRAGYPDPRDWALRGEPGANRCDRP